MSAGGELRGAPAFGERRPAKDIAWRGRTVRTGIWKAAVAGRRRVRRLNIDGDGQGDLIGHGGEQRAVLVYQIDCYRYWQAQLHRNDFTCGQFGENFTVDGLPDDEVWIGDRYRIGSALLSIGPPTVLMEVQPLCLPVEPLSLNVVQLA